MFSILTQNNYLWEENAMWHVHIGQDLIQSNVENSFGHSKCWSRQHSFIASKYVNRRCLVNKISIQDYKVHTKEKKEHSDRSWSIISSSIKHVCLNFYWMSLFYFVYVYLHLCSMIKAFKKWCGFSWLGLQGLWSQEILLLLFSINSWWHHWKDKDVKIESIPASNLGGFPTPPNTSASVHTLWRGICKM